MGALIYVQAERNGKNDIMCQVRQALQIITLRFMQPSRILRRPGLCRNPESDAGQCQK